MPKDINNGLKQKLMAVQEDLLDCDAWIKAPHRKYWRYSDIWRKRLENSITAARTELEDAIREYQRIFENSKEQ